MKLILTLIIFLNLNAFAQVALIGKRKYKPLKKNQAVKVIYKNKTDFDFIHEDLCRITIKGSKKALKKYHPVIKQKARQCGANAALVTLAKSKGKRMLIKAIGMKITSDKKKIGDTLYDQLILAINNDNLDSFKVLLEKIDKRRGKRAPSDSLKLDSLFYHAASKGLQCNPDILQFLNSYQSILAKFDFDKNKYLDGIPEEKLIYCGNALELFFPDIKDKVKFINNLNTFYKGFLAKSSKAKNNKEDLFKFRLDRYRALYKRIESYLNEECQVSKRRKSCSLIREVKKNARSSEKIFKSV